MLAKDITFGIEIEALIPQDHAPAFQPGAYHNGFQVQQAPAGWNSQRDGSLVDVPAGYMAAEVVSPILKGEEGLVQVYYMAQYLERIGAKFNGTTGMHIHVNGSQMTTFHLEKLAKLFREHEAAFLALNGDKVGYRINNRYTQLSPQWSRLVDEGNRYRSLNFANLRNSKGTVEFRLFQGTADPAVITMAVYMVVALVAHVSQMDYEQATKLTKYPRPMSFREAAHKFNEAFFVGKPNNHIVPDASIDDEPITLYEQADKADRMPGPSYSRKVQEAWGHRITA